MRTNRIVLAIAIILFFCPIPLSASAQGKIVVAVAANFISPFKELSAGFEAKTKIKVEGTYSSTGNFYSQIVNGAPYDLFLSADENRPAILYKDGLADRPFVYARGQVILWAANKNFCQAKRWQAALKSEKITKIAVANPVTAPYGAAAKAALQKAGLWDSLQRKIVNAQDIAQSFQYAQISAVDAGFCALSAVASPEGKKGCFYTIPEAPEIVQAACILTNTKNRVAVEKFISFLNSFEGRAIKVKFGYK